MDRVEHLKATLDISRLFCFILCLPFFLEARGCKGRWGRSLQSIFTFVVVQSLSHSQLFATPWTAAHQASRSFTISQVCSNSCPLNSWCHPTISSSVAPFSSCPQSFPASGSFPINQLFRWPKYWSFSNLLYFQDLVSVFPSPGNNITVVFTSWFEGGFILIPSQM